MPEPVSLAWGAPLPTRPKLTRRGAPPSKPSDASVTTVQPPVGTVLRDVTGKVWERAPGNLPPDWPSKDAWWSPGSPFPYLWRDVEPRGPLAVLYDPRGTDA